MRLYPFPEEWKNSTEACIVFRLSDYGGFIEFMPKSRWEIVKDYSMYKAAVLLATVPFRMDEHLTPELLIEVNRCMLDASEEECKKERAELAAKEIQLKHLREQLLCLTAPVNTDGTLNAEYQEVPNDSSIDPDIPF